MYIAIDGDEIGSRMEAYILECHEEMIKKYNMQVNQFLEIIKLYLIKKNIRVILDAGDSILGEGTIILEETIEFFRKNSKNDVTVSVGIGDSMRDSYIALKYAKATGKKRLITYREGIFSTVLL